MAAPNNYSNSEGNNMGWIVAILLILIILIGGYFAFAHKSETMIDTTSSDTTGMDGTTGTMDTSANSDVTGSMTITSTTTTVTGSTTNP